MGAAMPPMRHLSGVLAALTAMTLCPLAGMASSSHIYPSRRYSHVRFGRGPLAVVPRVRAVPHVAPPKPHVPTAADLYPKSLQADTLYSYRGRQVTTYWGIGYSEAVIVSHRASSLRRIDYLAPDDERGRSVVTAGLQEWQYDPRSRQLLHRRLQPDEQDVSDAGQNYDLLRTNYVLEVEPKPNLWADRKVFVITITRKANRVTARKLWLDADTGLVLKREIYREDGKLAVTVSFSDIDYHAALPPSLFDLSSLGLRPGVKRVEEGETTETSVPLGAAHTQLGGVALTPPNLTGYQLVSAALTADGPTPLLHLRYSDGLNLVSLFEQKRTQPHRPTRVPKSMRPLQIGRWSGHVDRQTSLTALNWDTPSLNVTLMGEISQRSLLDLALVVDPSGR